MDFFFHDRTSSRFSLREEKFVTMILDGLRDAKPDLTHPEIQKEITQLRLRELGQA